MKYLLLLALILSSCINKRLENEKNKQKIEIEKSEVKKMLEQFDSKKAEEYKRNKCKDSLQSIEKKYFSQPKDQTYMYAKGSLLYCMKEYEKAIEFFTHAEEKIYLFPQERKIRIEQAQILLSNRNKQITKRDSLMDQLTKFIENEGHKTRDNNYHDFLNKEKGNHEILLFFNENAKLPNYEYSDKGGPWK